MRMISRATAVQKDVSVPTAVQQSLEGTVKAMRIVGSMAVPAVVLKCRMLPMTCPKAVKASVDSKEDGECNMDD